MMNERQLRYVMEIAKEGNITAAAQNLYITQPSLSNLLTSVEKELGAKLFDRSVSPMTLTYAGEKYIAAAERIMENIHELQHQIDDMNDSLTGRLHIGCGQQISSFFLPAILPIMMSQYPGVQIKLTEENYETLKEQLLNGTLDVILCGEKINHQYVECIPLLKQEMLFLAPKSFKPLVVKDMCSKSFPCIDLCAHADIPMVLMKKNHQMRIMQDRIFSDNQYIPNIILETDNGYTCLHMVESGIAFAILPNMKAGYNIKEIEAYSFEKDYYRQTYLCYRKNAYFPKILGEFTHITQAVFIQSSP